MLKALLIVTVAVSGLTQASRSSFQDAAWSGPKLLIKAQGESQDSSGRRLAFEVSIDGSDGPAGVVQLRPKFSGAPEVLLPSPLRAVLVIPGPGTLREIWLIDETAAILANQTCQRVQVPGGPDRLFCDGVGSSRSIDLRTGATQEAVPFNRAALEFLRSPNVEQRIAAVRLIRQTPPLRTNYAVQTELRKALAEEVLRDAAAAKAEVNSSAGKSGIRIHSRSRELLGALVELAAELRDADALRIIAAADVSGLSDALARFGADAVNPILTILSENRRVGYSRYYEQRLLAGLRLVWSALGEDKDVKARVAVAAWRVISKPVSGEALASALELVDRFEDERLDETLRKLAVPSEVWALGVENHEAQKLVADTVRELTSRRLDLRIKR